MAATTLTSHIRQYETWRNGIDGDSKRSQVHRKTPREKSDRGFSTGVERRTWKTRSMSSDGRDVNDAAEAPFFHRFNDG